MPTNDYSASDSLRVAAKVLRPDDPNNPRSPEFAAAAAAANQAARQAEAARATAAPGKLSAPPQPATATPAQRPPRKRQKRRAHSRRVAPARANETSSERHERVCTICNHEDRAEIEREFINWIHPETTARYYKIEWRSIYRHAHAKGLFPVRQHNLKFALGHMVELASQVAPTMDGILRAIRAFSSLDRNGRWQEIPTHVVVSSGSQLAKSQMLADSVKSLTLRTGLDPQSLPELSSTQPDSAPGDASERTVLLDNENK